MKFKLSLAVLLISASGLVIASLPFPGQPGAINDPRYCGEPARDSNGRIIRSRAVLNEFAKVFPCPSTLSPISSCPGWHIDHVIPLASGGCDTKVNLQWLPVQIKSCSLPACKDRWERNYHAMPRKAVVLP